MSYFNAMGFECAHYPQEWRRVLGQIQGWSSSYPIFRGISQPLEAKALYVFTVARRLIQAANRLNNQANGWKPVFLEATVLLFPMIELIGYSRVDDSEVRNIFSGTNVSTVNLWAGYHWLLNPSWLPAVQNQNQRADSTLLSKWQIGHLVSLRHYLLHGYKQIRSYMGSPVPIDDIINYELPEYVVTRAQQTLPDYWQQLKQDDGSDGWVQRLVQADIRPLKLQGSNLYEEGLVDLDIVDCLEGNASFLG